MNELDLHYPPDTCPFCNIAKAFPGPSATMTAPASPPSSSSTNTKSSSASPSTPSISSSSPSASQRSLSATADLQSRDLRYLLSCIPSGSDAKPEKTSPSSYVILASEDVIAFLDILPMTRGHVLVATRDHRVKVGDLVGGEGASVGFWLPVLSRVVSRVSGAMDYNIVQNNGARAAQVVPHIHFHLIPRPETMPQIKSKSWTMFGRGQREELDDDEGAALAAEMRRVLREELEKMAGRGMAKL